MTIQYSPPALEYVITSSYAQKRLAHRTGTVVVFDGTNQPLPNLTREGSILDMYGVAVEYQEIHPTAVIRVEEHICTSMFAREFPQVYR